MCGALQRDVVHHLTRPAHNDALNLNLHARTSGDEGAAVVLLVGSAAAYLAIAAEHKLGHKALLRVPLRAELLLSAHKNA